jgi:hypothetical protein
MESANEKAKRLGVPLKSTPPYFKEQPQNPLRGTAETMEDKFKRLMNHTTCVCETCNKELTRQQEHPCGNMLCPFGRLSF